MSTVSVNLSLFEYVKVNSGLNPLVLQAHNDAVRITMSSGKPVRNNTIFHKLTGGNDPLVFDSIDNDVWAIATTDKSSLIVTELNPYTDSISNDYLINVARGLVAGHRIIHKFGYGVVGSTLTPITASGFWRTPITATALEFVSSSANDATGGTGATKIVIQGIDENWEESTEEIATNGTTAVAIPTSLLRLHRWYVSESGTYANETTGSHAGTLTIREAGAGQTWDVIAGSAPFSAQSEIGVATIPLGHTGYILSKRMFADTNKSADFHLMQRQFANDVTTPFAGVRRIIERDIGITGDYSVNFSAPKGPYVGPTDIGFMASTNPTGAGGGGGGGGGGFSDVDVSVDYELLIIEDGY